ncbi:MAG TPA: PP2C family serine/threonine-protein phosphatase [Acidobacteriaceae bacterium]|nr:PP2C family serine/threonine-protein phosphatase [Acidobacteriaceae bacterium]
MLKLQFGQATHPGRLRSSNEDRMGASIPESRGQARSHGWLFVVADGVTGLGLGDVAANAAVRLMQDEFFDAPPSSSLVAVLRDLIGRANTAVHDETLLPERRGKRMETSVVACVVRGDEAVVAHLGDSRLYQIRDGQIVFLTDHHAFVDEQRKIQPITVAGQSPSEIRHVPSRSLGSSSFVHVDTVTLPVRTGDCFVLCTSGVYKAMYDDEIARIVATKEHPQDIADEIVQHAIEVDGSDNATAQVVRIESVETAAAYRSRPYRVV